jgi:alanine-glyoxylate transaminase/serine-glyoxylate transaminase/serine-pyruvate transaminase
MVEFELNERNLLMIPGPTNVDPSVLRSLSCPTLSHVSGDFAAILRETISNLEKIFQTHGVVLPVAGTGTLGAEIALTNILEPADRVLAISGGYFGDRLAEMATVLGASVDKMQIQWGETVDVREVERRLSATRYKAVLAVHVDTSTGAVNPASQLAEAAKSNGSLFVLDAVCSLGGMELAMDAWGIDVCFAGSQKALAAPPGLAIVAFGPSAMRTRENRRSPMATYYGDIKRWSPVLQDATNYFATHPVNMIYALNRSCEMILSEGLENRVKRHSRIANAFRAAIQSMGLKLLCKETESANTMTVTYYPTGIEDARFRKSVSESGIVVAGGLGPLKGRTFRVGHMGNIDQNDLLATVSAIEKALVDQRHSFTLGAGVAAASRML